VMARRHCHTDFFFSLSPLRPVHRLQRIFSLATRFSVEVETHPVKSDEYCFLTEGGVFRLTAAAPIASHFLLRR
jgi:hypothetical protein